METIATKNEKTLTGKMEVLLAIAAATAVNCIPCFEHLYEKAVTSGITTDEIRRASDIAGLVKSGAHAAISGSIDELIGPPKDHCSAAVQNASGCSCR
jgi:alkylhydroperoxidase/carboxymuconolactone decarboxylase family protein YurZ